MYCLVTLLFLVMIWALCEFYAGECLDLATIAIDAPIKRQDTGGLRVP